ncbi:uncharacterized protein N7482_007596 [Penicillium canariense]|uniref:Uncharacterized protein n=1 Tax=Penicillium canariense TaxID=189055 RepID=A0A9W9LJA7_9EURO|nr:uncharacterized protein N7482_007596 [Penicillium canariense]KAJ5160592.1 hypothetical protein N7482_007596 [Penicillium canariense]
MSSSDRCLATKPSLVSSTTQTLGLHVSSSARRRSQVGPEPDYHQSSWAVPRRRYLVRSRDSGTTEGCPAPTSLVYRLVACHTHGCETIVVLDQGEAEAMRSCDMPIMDHRGRMENTAACRVVAIGLDHRLVSLSVRVSAGARPAPPLPLRRQSPQFTASNNHRIQQQST